MDFGFDAIDDNAAAFAKTLEAISLHTEGSVEQLIRAKLLKVFRQIIMRSPVDTGLYKGNHGISVEEPDSALIVEKPIGKDEKVNFRVFNQGKIEHFNWTIKDEQVWLFNNLKYASAIENGHSGQAAQGVYAITLAEFDQHFNRKSQNLASLNNGPGRYQIGAFRGD